WLWFGRGGISWSLLIHSRDPKSTAGRFINLDQRSAQPHFARSDRKRCEKICNKPVHDRFDGAPENGIYRTAHSRVAQESCAAGKDLFISCLNVGVSPNNSRNLPVEKSAQRDFLARGFPVCVHDDVCRLVAHLRYCFFDSTKRVFQNRLHKRTSLHIDNAD